MVKTYSHAEVKTYSLAEAKIGDRVKLDPNSGYTGGGLVSGRTYVVSDKNSQYIYLDGFTSGSGMGHHAFNFIKVEEEGQYILILKDMAGGLAPSAHPRIYSTEAQAKAVAASMAEKHPGQEFLIFKAVGKAKTNAATVEMF